MTKWERRSIRATLRQRDGDACHWCKRLMLFGRRRAFGIREPDNWATIEHVTPVSQGGTSDMSNLALACKLCNSSRATSKALSKAA